MMIKVKNYRNRVLCAVTVLLLVFSSAFIPFANSAVAGAGGDADIIVNDSDWDFHGIPLANGQKLTAYHMSLPLTTHNVPKAYFEKFCNKFDLFASADMGVFYDYIEWKWPWESKTYHLDVTIVVTFTNLIYTDANGVRRNIMIMIPYTDLVVVYEPWNGYPRLYFNSDVESVSLTNNYYKWIRDKSGQNFDDVEVAVWYKGVSSRVKWNWDVLFPNDYYKVNFSGVKIWEDELPAEVTNPDDPAFDVDFGNTGSNVTGDIDQHPEGVTAETSFWDFLGGLFGTAADDIKFVLMLIAGIFVLLLVLPLLINIIKAVWSD